MYEVRIPCPGYALLSVCGYAGGARKRPSGTARGRSADARRKARLIPRRELTRPSAGRYSLFFYHHHLTSISTNLHFPSPTTPSPMTDSHASIELLDLAALTLNDRSDARSSAASSTAESLDLPDTPPLSPEVARRGKR